MSAALDFLSRSAPLPSVLSRTLPVLPPPPPPPTYHGTGRHGERLGGVRIIRGWQHALAGNRRAGALHRQLRAGVSGAGDSGGQDGRRVGQRQQSASGLSCVWTGRRLLSLWMEPDQLLSLPPVDRRPEQQKRWKLDVFEGEGLHQACKSASLKAESWFHSWATE